MNSSNEDCSRIKYVYKRIHLIQAFCKRNNIVNRRIITHMCHDTNLQCRCEYTIEGLYSGKFVKTMIIIKGLKKVPKLDIPSNITVTISEWRLNEKVGKNCFSRVGP